MANNKNLQKPSSTGEDENDAERIKIAFDLKLKQPACAILQAGLGCDPSIAFKFPEKTWLVFPTPDLRVVKVTKDQLRQLIEYVSAKVNNRP